MIKKLKLKFILISMISVFLVLVSTIAAINISNYVFVERDSKNSLTEILKYADMEEQGPPMFKAEPQPDQQPPEGRRFRENSFFIVSFDSSGNIQKLNYNHVFELTEDQCKELATKVYKDELTGRKYDTFRFQKETKENGITYVAFIVGVLVSAKSI